MLLRGVRAVAALVNPDEPEAVTQRAFDAARAHSPAHATLPRARQVTERLRLPWSEVLELAQLPVQTQQRRLSKKAGEEEQDWVSAEHVGAVLGIVAARLGVTTLTEIQYSVERERMLAESKRRKPALLLPTGAQIRFAMRREIHGDPHRATPTKGTWDRALELAGLETNQRPARKVAGVGPVELLETAYEKFGTQLTVGEVEVFAKANGIRYSAARKRKWSEIVAAWKQGRTERGLAVPDGPPPLPERPDYAVGVGAARDGEQRYNKWDRDDCVAVLVEYVEQIPAGQRAGARHYRVWARNQTRAPHEMTLRRHGGWSKLLALAHDEVMRRRASGTVPL